MARLVWTGPALSDLDGIIAYVRKDSPRNARKLGQRLRQAPKILKSQPRLGGMVPDFELDELRELIVDPYRIIYRIKDDACYVVAVVHGSRDLRRVIRWEDQQES